MKVVKRRIIKLFKAILYMIIYVVAFVIGNIMKLFSEQYRNVWLVAERGIDARDNGYVFFNYLCKKHPEINAYYIISRDSVDYDKVSKIGNIVVYRSFKHHIMLAISKYKISTHLMGYSPDMIIYIWIDRLHLIGGKKIFLQHGIIKDDMKACHYPYVRVDIFNTSAEPEYKYIKEVYGHKNGVVQMLGMCRYDNLPDENKESRKQILLMPTWRTEIILSCKNSEDFERTEYYKTYQSLLNNDRINAFLDEWDYELVFYPHIEIQKYIKSFSTNSDNIIIASFNDYDVQNLLITSKVLITDYSSVYFDFAYMHKMVIYYQFDELEYRKEHYQVGYYIYRDNGFGPVYTTEDEIINYLLANIEKNFVVEDIYMSRIQEFFTLRDKKNCERIYNAICKL